MPIPIRSGMADKQLHVIINIYLFNMQFAFDREFSEFYS